MSKWYAKRVVEGEIITITTYEKNKPVFTEEQKAEWHEIDEAEYNQILINIQEKQRQAAEEYLLKNQDVEITDEE